MKYSELKAVVNEQIDMLYSFELGTSRELLGSLPVINSHALVVSGIRRCGKSVLLHQFIRNEIDEVFYFNFADIRLYEFSASDFVLLDEIIRESGKKILFFDEIQIVKGWELFVRQKLDQSIRIIITGSNARMLSAELGTNLTGRHISKELFPFNYREFCSFHAMPYNKESLLLFLNNGGFPEFLKTNNSELLSFLIEDIIYRDIATRHAIRDISGLKNLCIYVISNTAKLVSPSKLTTIIGVKSPSTVLEYLSHFESSYLLNLISRFSYSVKGQMLSEKKIYVVDNGLVNVASISASKDMGRKFENAVYWSIRRKTKNIWYFSDGNSECDFIYKLDDNYFAIQVCYEMNGDNQEREINGLLAALKFFNLSEGIILTVDQTDKILTNGYKINVVPAYQFDLS
ncbi:MAG: ATP-binding protein [Prolixibacteraceae bacterium]|nr:ATP-binding protein [Prolixibacteraceae bacterium]